MRIYATKVTKGIVHRNNQPDEIIAVIGFRNWNGWGGVFEMDKTTWKLVGEVMGWKLHEKTKV